MEAKALSMNDAKGLLWGDGGSRKQSMNLTYCCNSLSPNFKWSIFNETCGAWGVTSWKIGLLQPLSTAILPLRATGLQVEGLWSLRHYLAKDQVITHIINYKPFPLGATVREFWGWRGNLLCKFSLVGPPIVDWSLPPKLNFYPEELDIYHEDPKRNLYARPRKMIKLFRIYRARIKRKTVWSWMTWQWADIWWKLNGYRSNNLGAPISNCDLILERPKFNKFKRFGIYHSFYNPFNHNYMEPRKRFMQQLVGKCQIERPKTLQQYSRGVPTLEFMYNIFSAQQMRHHLWIGFTSKLSFLSCLM